MFETVKYSSCGKFLSRGDWSHPDRVIETFEAIFVTEGTVYINENGIEYALEPNDVLILEPYKRHFGYKTGKNTSFFWLHWQNSPDFLVNTKHRKISNTYNLSLMLCQLLEYRTSESFQERLDYLTRLILIELCSNQGQSHKNPIVERASSWISANCDIPLKASQVARHLGYNSDYLNRIFKKTYSCSLKEYIDSEKMKFIKGLMLTTNFTLAEIASRSGFREYKYFLKFFKYHEGISPTEFYGIYAGAETNTGER